MIEDTTYQNWPRELTLSSAYSFNTPRDVNNLSISNVPSRVEELFVVWNTKVKCQCVL